MRIILRRDGRQSAARIPRAAHTGKVLILFLIALPMLIGLLGLVVDGGLLMVESRRLQSIADGAATAGAGELARGETVSTATTAAMALVHQDNGLPDADVAVHIPPITGSYAGNGDYAEVEVSNMVETYFIQLIREETSSRVSARAVAGAAISTSEGVLVVLDPAPPAVSLAGAPVALPALPPAHLGGLEVIGAGRLRVKGGVFVNTEWGGVDEQGDPAGNGPGPPYGVSCTPLLPLTGLRATDIRVTGGVDNPSNYGHVEAGESSPLEASKQPVPDPYRELPAPTLAADAANVTGVLRGSIRVAGLPLLSPPVVLHPGVYEWIEVVSGQAVFNPGVYIVRNVNPITGLALSIVAGKTTAEGVMFYITDSAAYVPATGLPDAADGETTSPSPEIQTLLPRVVINAGLLGSRFSGLDDAASPFDGILIYQRRLLRQPLVIVAEQLVGPTDLSGNIYAKWGQLVFVGHGTYDLAFAVGSARIVNVLDLTLAPTHPFPPVKEVFLVE